MHKIFTSMPYTTVGRNTSKNQNSQTRERSIIVHQLDGTLYSY